MYRFTSLMIVIGLSVGQWCHMPLIQALQRQAQEDLWVWGQPGIKREFYDGQGYREKLSLKKRHKNIVEYECL